MSRWNLWTHILQACLLVEARLHGQTTLFLARGRLSTPRGSWLLLLLILFGWLDGGSYKSLLESHAFFTHPARSKVDLATCGALTAL